VPRVLAKKRKNVVKIKKKHLKTFNKKLSLICSTSCRMPNAVDAVYSWK